MDAEQRATLDFARAAIRHSWEVHEAVRTMRADRERSMARANASWIVEARIEREHREANRRSSRERR